VRSAVRKATKDDVELCISAAVAAALSAALEVVDVSTTKDAWTPLLSLRTLCGLPSTTSRRRAAERVRESTCDKSMPRVAAMALLSETFIASVTSSTVSPPRVRLTCCSTKRAGSAVGMKAEGCLLGKGVGRYVGNPTLVGRVVGCLLGCVDGV